MQTSSNHHKEMKTPQQIHDTNDRKFEVICRVRPLQHSQTSQDITISDQSPTVTIFNHPKNSSKEFTFHRVYGQMTKQAQFSQNMVDQIYLNCLQNGKGCLILSYGVTNSGKTYTILGNEQEPGILPTLIAKFEQELPSSKIFIRAMEVYTDEIYCLRNGQKLQLKETWTGYEFIGGCQYEQITRNTTKEIIDAFIRNRKAAQTNANRASSRSHAIFMIQCGNYHLGITDLAGNERFGTNANVQQTFSINKNLLVLGKCIHAFRDGDRMPYRECKLTLALMEYFKPCYKIFMIAHLNRSGLMFHQNLNVLQYAAVSTQVKHINLKKNPSIMKSMRKRDKQVSVVDLSQKKNQFKEAERRQNKFLLERYKCYIMGVNQQASEDLDKYFKEEDQKDLKFLQELKETKYVSPTKTKKAWLDKLEAQSRIKLRKIFLSEMRAEKEQKQVDFATEMGPSMQKISQELLPKTQQKLALSTTIQTKVDCSTFMGTSMKKNLKQFYHNASDLAASNNDQQSLTTPLKPTSSPQSESFIKKVMKNPALMIQSGFRMISSFNQVANNMVESFKGLMKEHQQNGKKIDLHEEIQKISNLIITPQTGMEIIVAGKHEAQMNKLKGSKSHRKHQSSKQVVIYPQQIQFKQQPQRLSIDHPIPFSSQQSTILINRNKSSHKDHRQDETNNQNQYIIPLQNNNILNEIDNSPAQTAQFMKENINALNINIVVNTINNKTENVEESLLLDGLRSEKDVSTNRTSQVDLLHSEQSIKNHQKAIEPIPQQAQIQTTTKSPFKYECRNNQISLYLQNKQNNKSNHHRPQMEIKYNETGFKSTQQTYPNPSQQQSNSRSKNNSKSANQKYFHKKSYSINLSCQKVEQERRYKNQEIKASNNNKKLDPTRIVINHSCQKIKGQQSMKVSGIKTRNQRKKESVDPAQKRKNSKYHKKRMHINF